jgi:hypothetical protein
MVVLHRVGRTEAGPVDSMRSDARGRFRFEYRTTTDSAVYFASSMYSGIAYFTRPFSDRDVQPEAATITVYDTSSTNAHIITRSHHVIVFAEDSAKRRRVAEVYWLENSTPFTRVASRDGPAWSTRLPAGTIGARIDDGNIPVDGVRIAPGGMQVFAPLAPGVHQLHVVYDIAAAAFPLTVPLVDSTMVLEVLIEDTAAVASGAGLVGQESVTVEQRSFQRLLAHDVPPASSFEIAFRRPLADRTRYLVVGAMITVTLALVGWTAMRRRRATS